MDCQSGKPKGRLLITGTTGDVGLACGKSSLAKLLAKSVTEYPIFARLEMVECTSMRGECVFDTETSAHKQKVYLYKEYRQSFVYVSSFHTKLIALISMGLASLSYVHSV